MMSSGRIVVIKIDPDAVVRQSNRVSYEFRLAMVDSMFQLLTIYDGSVGELQKLCDNAKNVDMTKPSHSVKFIEWNDKDIIASGGRGFIYFWHYKRAKFERSKVDFVVKARDIYSEHLFYKKKLLPQVDGHAALERYRTRQVEHQRNNDEAISSLVEALVLLQRRKAYAEHLVDKGLWKIQQGEEMSIRELLEEIKEALTTIDE
ncbi:hypothetical protein EJB05_35924, partial [Eragrostis curvula]